MILVKNLVVFSDGTNNAGSVSSEETTNVWRLYRACPVIKDEQVTFYDAGLGRRRMPTRRKPISTGPTDT